MSDITTRAGRECSTCHAVVNFETEHEHERWHQRLRMIIRAASLGGLRSDDPLWDELW